MSNPLGVRTTFATPPTDPGEWWMGEENETAADCVHCGWPVFLDCERDADTGEEIAPHDSYWQHNDDRYYTPWPTFSLPYRSV